MSKFNDKQALMRYRILAWVVLIMAAAIVVKAAYIMTAQRDYWTQVDRKSVV